MCSTFHMRFVFHPIILFCIALTILSAAGASTYGTSGECLNQPTEYGYDLNDIHSDCPPTQFCSSSLVCVDRFSDGVPTLNQNPKVVCLNGASEVETTLGFLSSTVERLCSSKSVGEMCVSLPDPCTTNYCLDPWGFTYPAERVAETSSEVQLRESFEFLNKALNAKNRAFSEYVQSMNYAMLSSQAYLVYLKYLYYIRDKDINAFYEDFLSDKNLFQQTTVVDDDDYWYFQLAQTTCSTDNSSTVNRAANELFKSDSHYATTLMTVLDTFLDELEQLYLSHGLNYEESTASNPYKAYVRFRDMYRNPILSAAITFKDGTELPIDSNRCLELHNYADAKYKEKISNEKNADYNITLTYYQQTNASNPVLGYTKIKFKCREVCYDRDSHKPKTELSKNAFDNLIACPPSVPDCNSDSNPVPFSEHEGVSHIRGCSFNIDFGAMTINWNKDLEDGLHSRSGWSYVCAETRSPTKYTFSLVTCPQSYTIDTKEQCLSAALFLERPLDTQIYAEELVLKAPYTDGRNDGTGYTVEFMHFSCTSTHQLFPTNLSPTLNGCGPSVGYAGLVELFNDVALKPQDVDCCNAHDACYAGVECTEPGNCTAMDLSGGFSSKDCEDAFEKCISDIPDGQGSELAKSFPGRVLDLSPHFVSSDSFKCVDKSENNPANIQTRPNGYSFEKRLRFMIADGIDNCAGYTATDPLFTNHWSSNSSSQWTSQDVANSYSDFGPCGKYGTCLGVPNMQNSPPLMSVSPFTNENRQYHNNITCKCTRGQGYFCEESLCDNYCKNEGECTLIGGSPACDCVNGTWGPDCSMSSVEGSATGEWTRNGNDQAMWWVPYEGSDLYTYEPMESDYGDDGADEVSVVVKSRANYACFGSMRSCSNNPENDADKSMVVMLTDMSEVGEEIENGMDWWRIQLAMDGGADWDAKRQKGIEAVLPRFNYFDKKANASVEVLDQYKIFVAAEKNNYAEAHGKYTTDTDILAKLNWWNMYVDSITTFGTALLREQFPVQADTSVRVLNENSCNETTIRTQMEQIITEEGGIRKWPSSFNRDDKILQLLENGQVYDPIEHRGWAYFSDRFNHKLGESGWLGDSERDTTQALLLVNVWIDSLESDVRQALFRSLCRGNATLGIRHPPDIIEFDCDNIGEKSADGWTCCAMSNPEFNCYDGSCWIPDENITDSSSCSGDTTNGASAICTSTSTTTHNSCPTSTPCEQVGDQCAAGGGQVCCEMDTDDKCDSLTCWVSNDEILDGTQLLSSCTRAQETSCSSTRACDRPGNVCQDLEGREYVCCDYPLLWAWLPADEQCNSGNCWHQIDELDSVNLLFKESILIHAKKSRDLARNSSQKAISANTAAQVSTQMFAAISLSREEGQLHRSLDFSIAALKQKPNVPLLGLSDFFDTMVEVIFSDASEELKSAVKISANVLTFPLQRMIPDIRSLKVALHMTEKVQHLSLTVRPHFVFSEANCQNAPETITCLLGSVAELAFGESEVSKFEQMMQSLKFKFKLQKKKDHKSFKATVALMLPIVLSDTNEMYIALENQNGGGPSIYLSHTKEKVEGAMTTKTVFGGEIPFRLKVGKKLDITIIGSFDYNIAKKQITLAARLPFWMMDVLPFTQIPIHIHDIGLKVDFFKSTNAAGDSGVNFQFMGGLCLGTENNCRMKTCDYIQGYIFKSVNLKKPEQNMDALLLSEVTFGKLLKVACSSEWFGYCDTYESKSQFMGEIASLEETAPWFINTGWSPLTPTCADPADTTGEGCCTRLEMIDPGKSFAKNCYSKIIVGGDYFAFKTSASTIIIEKGITVSGRAQFFGIAVGIYLKVNHWTTLGLLPRYKIDMHLQFDKFGIDGFLEVTQNETSAAGPYIAAAMMTPLKVDLSFQGYVKIVPLAIGVGISGRLHKTSKVSINASLTLFNQFDAQLQVEYWPMINMMFLYGGMNSVVVRVNSTGLNKFVAGAVASIRAGVAQSRTAITGAITTFQTNLISASGLCQSIFPTGGSLPASTNLLLAYFSFLGEGLFEVIKNFIEDSCTVIVGKILPVFLFGVNIVINSILALVDLMLMGVEALANGDLIVLDEFEASAAVGFQGAKGALKMKGKIFGFPFDVNPTFDATMANDGDLFGNILQIIKSHIGRRLAKTTDGRRRLSGNPDEVIQTMEAAIVAIGGVGQAIGDNLEAMFNEIVKFDFEKATEYLLQAVEAPQVALGFLNPGGRRRLFEVPDLEVNMAESMEAGLSTDGDQECDLLIDAAAQILQNNPALKECKYGCGLWKGKTTCLECSISNHTECGKGEFCDLGRCIPKKPYGAWLGIYDAETVCLSGKADGTFATDKCIDCHTDDDCSDEVEKRCNESVILGNWSGDDFEKRRLFCDNNKQCRSENIRKKRTDNVRCLNVGGCCDRYGHLWEKGCSSGDVRRGATVTPKCGNNCCREDNGVYVPGTSCNKKTQIKREDYKAEDDVSYKMDQKDCVWDCCNLDGTDAGYSKKGYCKDYAKDAHLYNEICGYDCCKEGGIGHGAGFLILLTDCLQNERNGACQCSSSDVKKGGDWYETITIDWAWHPTWIDDDGVKCGKKDSDAHGSWSYDGGEQCANYKRGEVYATDWLGKWKCAHTCCDDNGYSGDYSKWYCDEHPNTRRDYTSHKHTCGHGCCRKYHSSFVAAWANWARPACTDYQTVFETGRAMGAYDPTKYIYTRGDSVSVKCTHPCCFGSSVAAPEYFYCPDFEKEDIEAAGLWGGAHGKGTNNKWYSTSTRSLRGEKMQETCKHHCCNDDGDFSSMELHGECPDKVWDVVKGDVKVVKRGDPLAYNDTCGTGCCATDGTMTDHYSSNQGCRGTEDDRSYLPDSEYGGHTPVGSFFDQELDCDTLLHGEYNECVDSEKCEYKNGNANINDDTIDLKFGMYEPHCLHRTAILPFKHNSGGGWDDYCNTKAEQDAIDAEEAAKRQAEEAVKHQAEQAAKHQAEQAAKHQAEEAAKQQAIDDEQAVKQQAEEAVKQQAIDDEQAVKRQAEEAAKHQAEQDIKQAIIEENERRAALGPYLPDWWDSPPTESSYSIFDGVPRATIPTNKYTHIQDKSCSTYGASALSSPDECKEAAKQLGIMFLDYKVNTNPATPDPNPTGCYLWSPTSDGENLILHYNAEPFSTTSCGYEEHSQHQPNSVGCLCVHKYTRLTTDDTCGSAGMVSISSMEECKGAAIQVGLASENSLLSTTTESTANSSAPHCSQHSDGTIAYNAFSKRDQTLTREGYCSLKIDTSSKCFAIAERIGLANRPRRFATAVGWDCINIGDESDDGFKCCSANHNGCTDSTCWWEKSTPSSQTGLCSQTVTTPVHGTWPDRPTGCFIDEDFTPHFNTKSTLIQCGESYPCLCDELIRSGTCEEMGYTKLDSAEKCWRYAIERGWDSTNTHTSSSHHLPAGCSIDTIGHIHYNDISTSSTTCSNSFGCICDPLLRSGTCTNVIDTKLECFKAATAKGFRSGHHTSGTWGLVPPGCSVDSSGNPHFNDAPHVPTVDCSDTFGCLCVSTGTSQSCTSGCLCRQQYTTISSGTCASNGHGHIRSKDDCQTAAIAQNTHDYSSDITETGELATSLYPSYCFVDNNGQVYYNNLFGELAQENECIVNTFAISFSWQTTSTFTTCEQFKNEIGPYTGSNGGQILVNACNNGFQTGDCSTALSDDERIACNWGKLGQKASIKGCLCLLDSKCDSTELPMSDKSATGSITGVNGESVDFQCDDGYMLQGSDNRVSGTFTCNKHGIFTLDTYNFRPNHCSICNPVIRKLHKNDVCVPILRENSAFTTYRPLSPETKVRTISMSNSLEFSKHTTDATMYSKTRIHITDLPPFMRDELSQLEQTQRVDMYTQDITSMEDECEYGINCCSKALDIDTDTTFQLDIPLTTLNTKYCQLPITTLSECAAAVHTFDIQALYYTMDPTVVVTSNTTVVKQVEPTNRKTSPPGCFLKMSGPSTHRVVPYFNPELTSDTVCSHPSRDIEDSNAGCLCHIPNYNHVQIKSGVCEESIITSTECLVAANELKDSLQQPYEFISITELNSSIHPPGCFTLKNKNLSKAELFINTDTSSSAFCDSMNADGCLCKSNNNALAVLTLPPREKAWSITCNKGNVIGKKTLTTLASSSILAPISTKDNHSCIKHIPDTTKCKAAAVTLGISEELFIVNDPQLTSGCSHQLYTTISTGQCGDAASVLSIDECQYAAITLDKRATVTSDPTAPYGCNMKYHLGTVSVTFNSNKEKVQDAGIMDTICSPRLQTICKKNALYFNVHSSPPFCTNNNEQCICYGNKRYIALASEGTCSKSIMDYPTCQSAMEALGNGGTVLQTVDFQAPTGCYKHAGNFYFNTAENGTPGPCSSTKQCVCHGSAYKTECWDDYLRKWDSNLEKKESYYQCKMHKMSTMTNTIVPMTCPPIEVANSDFASTGSINGNIFTSIPVSCNEGYLGGGNASCDYHITKNEPESIPHHITNGFCKTPITNKHDCFKMAKSLHLEQIRLTSLSPTEQTQWFNPNFTSVNLLPFDGSKYPSGCILLRTDICGGADKIIPYFNPFYSNTDCANGPDSAGCVCNMFTKVSNGTCQSNGHLLLNNAQDCKKASFLLNKARRLEETINSTATGQCGSSICNNIVQTISSGSRCICRNIMDTIAPKPSGCFETSNGATFFNKMTGDAACSIDEPCLCSTGMKNNIFSSSNGSCLSLGFGYAPVTSSTKCLESAIETGLSATSVKEIFDLGRTPNCFKNNNGILHLNHAPSTVPCYSSGSEGCLCEKKFWHVPNCTSSGYDPILSEELCKEAALSLNLPSTSMCTQSGSNCVNGCLCQAKKIASFGEIKCNAIPDCKPTEVAHSNASTVGSINGNGNISVTCDVGYSGGGTVTCSPESNLFSTVSCQYCSKGYGYVSATNHTCIKCTDHGIGTNATYNSADYSDSICTSQACPFGMGIISNGSLNTHAEQDCVKCPENTFSDSADQGQCQHLLPGYRIKQNQMENLLQVSPPRIESVTFPVPDQQTPLFSSRRRRLSISHRKHRRLYLSEQLFIYEKNLFEIVNIPNLLLCELRLMMSKSLEVVGATQFIEIDQSNCWIPQDTNLPRNHGQYFVKEDGTKDMAYNLPVPTSQKIPTVFRYNVDNSTIYFGTNQYTGTFSGFTNPTASLVYGEFVLKWKSTNIGGNNHTEGLMSASVGGDGHYILTNHVKNVDGGIVQEEFLYRNITGNWTRTKRTDNNAVQTKTVKQSNYGARIETDLNGVKKDVCYFDSINLQVYEFTVGGVTTKINQIHVFECGDDFISGIPVVNMTKIREFDIGSMNQLNIGQMQVTCPVAAVAHSQHVLQQLQFGQSVQVQCDVGYISKNGVSNILCQTDGSYNSVQCLPQTCTSSQVDNSNASVSGSIVGVTGQSQYVQCDDGFFGSAYATCLASGIFSTVSCSRRVCEGNIDNSIMGLFQAFYGDSPSVQCAAGYSPSQATITCQADGTFTVVECIISFCFATIDNAIDNAIVDTTAALAHDESVTVHCNEGYFGGGVVRCNAETNTLSPVGNPVICTPNTCATANVPNSNASAIGSIVGVTGVSHYVQCVPGYIGSGVARCLTSGVFSTVTCLPIACSTPVFPTGVKQTQLNSYYGQPVQVQCDSGYEANTQKTVNFDYGFAEITACPGDIVTVNWKGYHNIREVSGSGCDSPYSSSSAVSLYKNNGYTMTFSNDELVALPGQRRYFKCDQHCGESASRFEVVCPAYNADSSVNSLTVGCDINGNFDIPNNSCVRKACQVSIANSNAINKIVQYQDSLNVQCDTHYQGGGVLVCGADGLYTDINGLYSDLSCTSTSCAPTQIEHSNKAETGSIQGSFGDTVLIKCNPLYRPLSYEGLTISNTVELKCLETGSFEDGECVLMYNFATPSGVYVPKDYILAIASELRTWHADKEERKANMVRLARHLYTSTKSSELTKRETVKLSKMEIEKGDFDSKMLEKMPKKAKKIYIVPSPPNAGAIDTCSNGQNDDNCCTYSFSDDAELDEDDVVVHETGEEVGSWSILCKGDILVSKQTQENDGLKMECWDNFGNAWGNTVRNMSSGEYYKCNSHTIMVGSQTPLGLTCETAAVNGSNLNVELITAFVDETVTVECDTNHVGGGVLTCGTDGNFSTNSVVCFPMYNGDIHYDCAKVKALHQEGGCCDGTLRSVSVTTDISISCSELKRGFNLHCACGVTEGALVPVSYSMQ